VIAVKKALKALQSAGQSVEFIDLRAVPVAAEQLQKWLDEHGDAVLVNVNQQHGAGLMIRRANSLFWRCLGRTQL
jgi:arsenate reductase-like glutaredoxin family protein